MTYLEKLNNEIKELELVYLATPTPDNYRKLHEVYKIIELYHICELSL